MIQKMSSRKIHGVRFVYAQVFFRSINVLSPDKVLVGFIITVVDIDDPCGDDKIIIIIAGLAKPAGLQVLTKTGNVSDRGATLRKAICNLQEKEAGKEETFFHIECFLIP